MSEVSGIHHVTCIAGEPQGNLDFYAGVLGMRLVKKRVNQDDPGTYHLFYADAAGQPGSDLTFFPWPHLPPGRRGIGLTDEVCLAVPADSLPFWADRLARYGVEVGEAEVRFDERAMPFRDPDGLRLALIETDDDRGFTPWSKSTVPEAQQIRRIHTVRLWERDMADTVDFLTETFRFSLLGSEDGWQRYGAGDGGSSRIVEVRELPDQPRGSWGIGSVHHVAWRVDDEETQLAVRGRVATAGRRPTEVIDRFWFRSVYFREPGGVLFELATDGPGFTVDEDPAKLGESLILPPWLEPSRGDIEAALPRLGGAAAVPADESV